MENWLKLFWAMLMDVRGEDKAEGDDPDNDDASGDDEDAGEGGDEQEKPDDNDNADDEDGSDESGQGEDDGDLPPEWADEFGEDASQDAIFEAYKNIKGKTTATEGNLATLRKALKEAGINVLRDADGNAILQVDDADDKKDTGKQKRFTDEHRQLLDDEMWDAVGAYVEDKWDEKLEHLQKEAEKTRQHVAIKSQANAKMMKLFPTLDIKNKDAFNQEFYDKATEIWSKDYKTNPKGELFAALEAAAEIGINPTNIEEARKEGYQKGRMTKKILGPVGGGKGGHSKKDYSKKLSKDEYLALSETDREKYDKKQAGIT